MLLLGVGLGLVILGSFRVRVRVRVRFWLGPSTQLDLFFFLADIFCLENFASCWGCYLDIIYVVEHVFLFFTVVHIINGDTTLTFSTEDLLPRHKKQKTNTAGK